MEPELTRRDILRLFIWLMLAFGMALMLWDRMAWKDSMEASYGAQMRYWKEQCDKTGLGDVDAMEVWKNISYIPQTGIQNQTG